MRLDAARCHLRKYREGKLMKEHKCYEANLARKAIIDSLSRESVGMIDVANNKS